VSTIAQDDARPRNDASADTETSILSSLDKTRQPRVEGGRIVLPILTAPTIQTADIGNGRVPEGFREGEPQPTQMLPESPADRGESWNWSVGQWAAADTFSHPRYFEDRMLERHGHERYPHLQPLASGARFFATVPMLPYLMIVRDPFECESTLGYYRSGSCAPIMLQRPPYERRAAIGEAAAIAGTIIAFP
tara:strand:+ start:41263 stop:41838 length:576 start_codon:yes stop_codon:yes gene_type:complete